MAIIQIKALCKSRQVWFNNDKIISIAADVSAIIMQRYQRAGWHVKSNFRQAIYLQCMKQMFDARIQDKEALSIKKEKGAEDQRETSYPEAIAEIEGYSIYSKMIQDYARRYKTMFYFLHAIAKYHTLAWIRDHIEALWVIYKGPMDVA